mmetsp:Transcript_13705/g.32627  ORF Transcript_13705/g.32627 Transcript_13705/m.32627 type:complete len:250 (-) Transcript_13705:55-804(-)
MHHFECLSDYVKHQLSERQVPFYCPALVRSAEGGEKQCRTQLGAADLQMLIDEEDMEKYDAYMIEKMQGTKVCGWPDCGYRALVGNDTSALRTGFPCPKCSKLCLLCGSKVHDGKTCEEAKSTQDPHFKQNEEAFKKYQKRAGSCVCPECGAVVEKNGGCDHIACRCGKHFMFRRGGKGAEMNMGPQMNVPNFGGANPYAAAAAAAGGADPFLGGLAGGNPYWPQRRIVPWRGRGRGGRGGRGGQRGGT